MTSTLIKTPGGKFGKRNRFVDDGANARITPGPNYKMESMPGINSSHNHITSPVLKGHVPQGTCCPNRDKPGAHPTMPNPSKDRTAWMIGATKDDMAYFASVSEKQGPAAYNTDPSPIKNRANRAVFTRENRSGNKNGPATFGTFGPGPMYLPIKFRLDYVKDKNPSWGMGPPGPKDGTQRQSFVFGQIKNGSMYRAIPATSDKASVDPATYRPDYIKHVLQRASVPCFAKQDRFGADALKRYTGKKHSKNSAGLYSPGPIYNPENGSISTWAARGRLGTSKQTPAGKWCP